MSQKRTVLSIMQEVCYQYWPSAGEMSYGSYSVQLGSESSEGKVKDIIMRELTLTDNMVCMELYSIGWSRGVSKVSIETP